MRKTRSSHPLRFELKQLLDKPILLESNPIEHIYKGGRLRAVFLGEPDPKDDYRSEEWIFSTNRAVTPGKHNPPKKGYSKIRMGKFTTTLDVLIREHPKVTVGMPHFHRYGAYLGVLMKIFNVGVGEQIPLHWHPTPEFASEHLNSPNGKNEAWIILAVQGEGKAWVGWKTDMSKSHLKTLLAPGNLNRVRSYMNEVKLEVGSVLNIPAGEIHSIGAETCVLEPQEPTDFSICAEWQRFQITEEEAHLGLGWDLALDAVNLQGMNTEEFSKKIMWPPQVTYSDPQGNMEEALITPDLEQYFRTDRLTIVTYLGIDKLIFGCHCLTITRGEGQLGWGNTEGTFDQEIPIHKGQSFFVPRSIANWCILTNTTDPPMEAIRCFPPPS